MFTERLYLIVATSLLFSFSADCMELPSLKSIMPKDEFGQKITIVKNWQRHLGQLAIMATNKKPLCRDHLFAHNHFQAPEEIFYLIVEQNAKFTPQGLKELAAYASTCKEWNIRIKSFHSQVFSNIDFIKSKLPYVEYKINTQADKILDHNKLYGYLILYTEIPVLPYIDPNIEKILPDVSVAKHFLDNKTQDTSSITEKTLEAGYNLICGHIKKMQNNPLFAPNYGDHLQRACHFFNPQQLESLIKNRGYTRREGKVCKNILDRYLSLEDSGEPILNLKFDFGVSIDLEIEKDAVEECQNLLYAHDPSLKNRRLKNS